MTNKSKAFISTVAVAGGAAAAYLLLRPTPTPEQAKDPVDDQFAQLEIVLNDLDAKVQQPEANVDSLFRILDTLRWQTIGSKAYEQQKRNLYIDHKRNVAMTFRKVVQERALDVQHPHLDDVESISE